MRFKLKKIKIKIFSYLDTLRNKNMPLSSKPTSNTINLDLVLAFRRVDLCENCNLMLYRVCAQPYTHKTYLK